MGRVKTLYDYYPFGSTRLDTGNGLHVSAYQYTGKELDEETGLNYYGARYYEAGTGRFTQSDPRLLRDLLEILANPQGLNAYAYTENNPIIYLDPTGESRTSSAFWNVLRGFAKQLASTIVAALQSGGMNNPIQDTYNAYNSAIQFNNQTYQVSYQLAYLIFLKKNDPEKYEAVMNEALANLSDEEADELVGKIAEIFAEAYVSARGIKGALKDEPVNRSVNWGKQNKHIPGTNNYLPGRSILTHSDPQGLVNKFSGTGMKLYNNGVVQSEVVDFGENIGYYVNRNGDAVSTNIGSIHYSNSGTHIVPERPDYFTHQ